MRKLIGRPVVVKYYNGEGLGKIDEGTLSGLPLTISEESGGIITHLTSSEARSLNEGRLKDIKLVA